MLIEWRVSWRSICGTDELRQLRDNLMQGCWDDTASRIALPSLTLYSGHLLHYCSFPSPTWSLSRDVRFGPYANVYMSATYLWQHARQVALLWRISIETHTWVAHWEYRHGFMSFSLRFQRKSGCLRKYRFRWLILRTWCQGSLWHFAEDLSTLTNMLTIELWLWPVL